MAATPVTGKACKFWKWNPPRRPNTSGDHAGPGAYRLQALLLILTHSNTSCSSLPATIPLATLCPLPRVPESLQLTETGGGLAFTHALSMGDAPPPLCCDEHMGLGLHVNVKVMVFFTAFLLVTWKSSERVKALVITYQELYVHHYT